MPFARHPLVCHLLQQDGPVDRTGIRRFSCRIYPSRSALALRLAPTRICGLPAHRRCRDAPRIKAVCATSVEAWRQGFTLQKYHDTTVASTSSGDRVRYAQCSTGTRGRAWAHPMVRPQCRRQPSRKQRIFRRMFRISRVKSLNDSGIHRGSSCERCARTRNGGKDGDHTHGSCKSGQRFVTASGPW